MNRRSPDHLCPAAGRAGPLTAGLSRLHSTLAVHAESDSTVQHGLPDSPGHLCPAAPRRAGPLAAAGLSRLHSSSTQVTPAWQSTVTTTLDSTIQQRRFTKQDICLY